MSTPRQKIKKLLIDYDISVADLAREYHQKTGRPCRRQEMSMCINGMRQYPELRDFLEKKFDRPIWSKKKTAKAA